MARIESAHARVRVTVAEQVYDVAFPAEIGDGEGQIPVAVAEKLLSVSTFPGEYQRVEDTPGAVPGLAVSEGHDAPDNAHEGGDQAGLTRPRRGRKADKDEPTSGK